MGAVKITSETTLTEWVARSVKPGCVKTCSVVRAEQTYHTSHEYNNLKNIKHDLSLKFYVNTKCESNVANRRLRNSTDKS